MARVAHSFYRAFYLAINSFPASRRRHNIPLRRWGVRSSDLKFQYASFIAEEFRGKLRPATGSVKCKGRSKKTAGLRTVQKRLFGRGKKREGRLLLMAPEMKIIAKNARDFHVGNGLHIPPLAIIPAGRALNLRIRDRA